MSLPAGKEKTNDTALRPFSAFTVASDGEGWQGTEVLTQNERSFFELSEIVAMADVRLEVFANRFGCHQALMLCRAHVGEFVGAGSVKLDAHGLGALIVADGFDVRGFHRFHSHQIFV